MTFRPACVAALLSLVAILAAGPAAAADTAEHRAHLCRRPRLRRRRLLRGDAGPDAEHRPAGAGGAAVHRRPCSRPPPARRRGMPCSPASIAWRKKGTGVLPGDAAADHRARPRDAARDAASGPATRRGSSASGTSGSASRRDRLERRRSSRARWRSASTSAFIMAATGDRVPCVYVEDHRVVGLDPARPDPGQLRRTRSATSRPARRTPSC